MNTYRIECFRPAGGSCPVRALTFLIDADSLEEAEEIAVARLARQHDWPGVDELELEIDTTYEVAL